MFNLEFDEGRLNFRDYSRRASVAFVFYYKKTFFGGEEVYWALENSQNILKPSINQYFLKIAKRLVEYFWKYLNTMSAVLKIFQSCKDTIEFDIYV